MKIYRWAIIIVIFCTGVLQATSPLTQAPSPPSQITSHASSILHHQSLISSLQSSVSGSSSAWAPVVVKATSLPGLVGAPIANLAVWVYGDTGWQMIPWQVDEVQAGQYVAQGDGVFNDADEISVMVSDLGGPAPVGPPGVAAIYQVSVTDPLSPTDPPRLGYLARMSEPVVPPSQDYVRYDTTTRRLIGQSYTIGLNAQRPFIDYLALNGSDENLLDRSKVIVMVNLCAFGRCVTYNEEDLPANPVEPVRDGPVRVVLSGQGGFAYRDWASLRAVADLSGQPVRVLQIQLSLDLRPSASGARYRDANVTDGVVIDGAPDSVPSLPYSPWRQVDHSTGRLITVFQVTSPHDRLLNLYSDDRTRDNSDTGDKLRYGEHGIVIDEPTGPTLDVDTALWALPPATSLDGATLAAHLASPLTVSVGYARFPLLYLPYLSKGGSMDLSPLAVE